MLSAFTGSSMPKRLLRHALSRLDLLDTDAIDIDNLDFAIGRNTVLEFRDVGLKLEKLERLLQLPPGLQIRRARVALLRLSVPMNFYTSPISANVVSANIYLTHIDQELPSDDDKVDPESVVPNAADLAQSFLDMQSVTEKQELEKALSGELSTEELEEDNDAESSVGTGQPLSLPGFLTGFIQGVVDRVEVSISDVTFRFEAEVPAQLNSTNQETASFVLKLDSIDVEGVTTKLSEVAASTGSSSSSRPVANQWKGKRHVALNKLRAYLVSDPRIFSLFSTVSPSGVPTAVLHRDSSFMAGPDASSYHGEDFLTGSPAFSNHSLDRHQSDAVTARPSSPVTSEDPTTPRQSASALDQVSPDASIEDLPSAISASIFDSNLGQSEDSLDQSPQHSQHGSENLLLSDDEHSDDQGLHSLHNLAHSESSSENGDDLLESRVFTHEYAESLYMSAASLRNPSGSQHLGQPQNKDHIKDVEEPAFTPALEADDLTGPLIKMSIKDLNPSGLSPQSELKPSTTTSTYVKSVHMPGGFGDWDSEPSSSGVYGGISQIETTRASGTTLDDNDAPPTPKFNRNSLDTGVLILEDDPSPSTPTKKAPFRPATTEGPPKSAKEILSLDRVSIYLPSQLSALPESTDNLEDEDNKLTASIADATGSMMNTFENLQNIDITTKTPQSTEVQAIEVDISPLEIRADISLGFIVSYMLSKLMKALEHKPAPTKNQRRASIKASKAEPESASSAVKVILDQVSILLVNKVQAFETPYSQVVVPEGLKSVADDDVILRLDVKDIQATSGNKNSDTQANLSIGKFHFGYNSDPDDAIVKFEHQELLQASIRDAFPEKGADIEMSFSKTKKESRVSVLTLPLRIDLDLPVLISLVDKFDGVSGLANMVTAMYYHMPSGLSRDVSTPKPREKLRGVRFDEEKKIESDLKTDIRIAGTRTQVRGLTCCVSLDTTSLKAALRSHGVAISCTKMQLQVPRTAADAASPVIVALHETRLEFFNTPQEADIDKLLDMLLPDPSHSKFSYKHDILIDTLFKQRRKGPLLRVYGKQVKAQACNLEKLDCLQDLNKDIAKLTEIAKYLPEDDLPGILTLAYIDAIDASVDMGPKFGKFNSRLTGSELAHVGTPLLLSLGVGTIYVDRNGYEILVDSTRNIAVPTLLENSGKAIVVHMFGNQPEPIVKIRMQDIAVEYRVPLLLDILGLDEDATAEEFETSLAESVANLGEVANANIDIDSMTDPKSKESEHKPLLIDLAFRDVLIGLNPYKVPSKMYTVIYDCSFKMNVPENGNFTAEAEIGKAWLMLTERQKTLIPISEIEALNEDHAESWVTTGLSKRGFAQVGYISSAIISAQSYPLPKSDSRQILIKMSETLVILETCADSLQTLINLSGSLSPPSPPSTEIKYRTAMEVQDLLASISGEAFGKAEGDYDFEHDFGHVQQYEELDGFSSSGSTDDLRMSAGVHGGNVGYHHVQRGEKLFDATSMTDSMISTQEEHDSVVLGHANQSEIDSEDEADLMIQSDYYDQKDDIADNVRLWDPAKGGYMLASKRLASHSPVVVEIRNVRLLWNLFDGYDWATTQNVIASAVKSVQTRVLGRQTRVLKSEIPDIEESESEDDEIGDFLFNSIYIGIPANHDPEELTSAINREINNNTDNDSVVTGTTHNSNSTIRTGHNRRTSKSKSKVPESSNKLHLKRSKHHKISFEATGIDADVKVLPADSGPTQSCTDIRVRALDIIDHLPQSTWRKFATYDRDHGARELDASQIHIELLNVKPVADLAASEFVVQVQVLPLRLHVDQDALDFLMRYFAFKDDTAAPSQTPGDAPFVSRFEIQHIPVKLDFKPRRVDYAALRSGKTSELMNFVTLQDAHIELRRIMLHGVMGFDKVGQILNDIWTPDVTKNQLPTVLAGLSLVRPLADVGSGMRDLIEVPMAEYRKDGRIFRSIKKGAVQFARNTGTNMIKLGAKVAVGTQNALEGAESLLTDNPQRPSSFSRNTEPPRAVSHYANQPLGVVQGLRGGYISLARDVMMAKDAIVAVSTQVMESEGAAGAAKAMLEAAPTIIFRPAIGASKAIGQTLLGATNTLDPLNRRRVEDKYKQ